MRTAPPTTPPSPGRPFSRIYLTESLLYYKRLAVADIPTFPPASPPSLLRSRFQRLSARDYLHFIVEPPKDALLGDLSYAPPIPLETPDASAVQAAIQWIDLTSTLQ